jgi:hypothetical protein
MATVQRKRQTNKKQARKAPKPGTTPADRRLLARAERETAEGRRAGAAEMIALDLAALAEKLGEAQNDFLSYRSEGGPDSDALELLGKLWSVRECLRGFAKSVRELGGAA